MITAIVMINCEVGKVHSVSEALVELDGVAEVYSISGQYDITAIIRVKEYDSLAQVLCDELARVPGITRTNTQMAFRCYSKRYGKNVVDLPMTTAGPLSAAIREAKGQGILPLVADIKPTSPRDGDLVVRRDAAELARTLVAAGARARRPLATPSGKVEIYSTILERLGYDPLPGYREPDEADGNWSRYPLLNISGPRTIPYHHSEFRHVESFRKQHPDPIAEIPVDTARRHGIADGDWVWIETPLGRVKQRARLTTSFAPGFISTQHAWWYPEKPAAEPSLYGLWESNINVTTDDDPEKCDPLSGGWPFKGQYLRCRISKASNRDEPS